MGAANTVRLLAAVRHYLLAGRSPGMQLIAFARPLWRLQDDLH
jgi:hypothetical protein